LLKHQQSSTLNEDQLLGTTSLTLTHIMAVALVTDQTAQVETPTRIYSYS